MSDFLRGDIMEPKEYTVRLIDGDYAHLVDVNTGEEILVARALLPEETDEGIRLRYENFAYTVIG